MYSLFIYILAHLSTVQIIAIIDQQAATLHRRADHDAFVMNTSPLSQLVQKLVCVVVFITHHYILNQISWWTTRKTESCCYWTITRLLSSRINIPRLLILHTTGKDTWLTHSGAYHHGVKSLQERHNDDMSKVADDIFSHHYIIGKNSLAIQLIVSASICELWNGYLL